MSLLSVIPRPTLVELGDQAYLASELTLGDLADLEAFIRDRHPNPFDVAAPFLDALQPHSLAFKRLLMDTMERVDEYATDLDQIRNSEEGIIQFLWVVLRREHPALTTEDVALMLKSTSIDQLARLSRVAWAPDPMSKLINLVDPPKEDEGPERDWAMGWYVYATKCKTGPQFHELTLTQFAVFMCQGEIPRANVMSGPAESFDWDRKNRITNYFKESDDDRDD